MAASNRVTIDQKNRSESFAGRNAFKNSCAIPPDAVDGTTHSAIR